MPEKPLANKLSEEARIKASAALRTLIQIGPDAIPFLLDRLEDKTPTRLKLPGGQFILGESMGFPTELRGNPLNSLENRLLSKPWTDNDDEVDYLLAYDQVMVGDLCLVALGQIVGRDYLVNRFEPTFIYKLNGPVQKKQLRERVRAIWSSKDPAKTLLDSLLIDYATEGIFNGKSLDGWGHGSDFQVQAAMRLLYYFPKQTGPLIAARLRALNVRDSGSDGWRKREVKNGVRILDFIKAVSWSRAPGIQEALTDMAKRTDDPVIKKALSDDDRSDQSKP